MLIFSSSLFYKTDLFLHVKICSPMSVVVWELCAAAHGRELTSPSQPCASPFLLPKKERKEGCDKPVTMKKAGKYRDRGAEGIFEGLLHFFLVLQWELK